MNPWTPQEPTRMSEAANVHDLTRYQRHESYLLREALAENAGNLSRAARWLGISRRSFHDKVGFYGLVPAEFKRLDG